MSQEIGAVVSRGLATMRELETVYSHSDLLDMYEILVVSNYNGWIASGGADRKRK